MSKDWMTPKRVKARKRNFHLFILSGMLGQLQHIMRDCQNCVTNPVFYETKYAKETISELINVIKEDKRSSYVKDSKNK